MNELILQLLDREMILTILLNVKFSLSALKLFTPLDYISYLTATLSSEKLPTAYC